MGNFFAFREFPALNILQSYPQLIGFNTSVYEYFVDQYNLCGYNLELKYPNPSLYPTLSPSTPPNKAMMTRSINAMRNFQQASLKQVLDLYSHDANTDADETLINGKRFVKRQSTGTDTPQPTLGPLGTIDSYYGCFLMEHIEDFAVNFTTPWGTPTFRLPIPASYSSICYLILPMTHVTHTFASAQSEIFSM